MWNVYKELRSVVETGLKDKGEGSVQKMEASLTLHKADFMDLLKNQVVLCFKSYTVLG